MSDSSNSPSGTPRELQKRLHALLADKPPPLGQIRDLLLNMHAAEIADTLESLPGKSRGKIWSLIDLERHGNVLSHLQDAVKTEFLEQMHPQEVVVTTQSLATDDAADIIQKFPEGVQDTILRSMDEQNRARLASALSYPKNTAGGLMNTDIVPIRANVSLDTVIRYLRRGVEHIPEKTDKLMVVDRKNRYLGVLPVISVIVSPPSATVGELTHKETGIAATLPANEVATLFEQRDLVSAAVVDDDGLLLGRITVDVVVDIIQEGADQVVRNMAGLPQYDMFSPVFSSVKNRALWLGINLLTALLGAWVIGRFEDTIQQLVTLAILLPLVAGMGGVAGSQTLTVAVRGIALDQLNHSNAKALMIKEVMVGLVNGIFWACVIGWIVALWFGSTSLGIIIGLAMIVNLVVAAFAGATIPLVLKRHGVDPAIAGSVLLTTVTDVVGFFAFLGLAAIFLIG